MKKTILQRITSVGLVVSLVGVVVSPAIVSAASSSANTTVDVTIGDGISVSTSGSVSFAITPTPGGALSSASDTVTVSTNNAAGYTLSLANADSSTDLVDGSNEIAAHAAPHATPTALANNTWGYAVAGGSFSGTYTAQNSNPADTTLWAGVPAAGPGSSLKTTATIAAGDTTTVWYAAKATTAQAPGTYSDTVTYTATTN